MVTSSSAVIALVSFSFSFLHNTHFSRICTLSLCAYFVIVITFDTTSKLWFLWSFMFTSFALFLLFSNTSLWRRRRFIIFYLMASSFSKLFLTMFMVSIGRELLAKITHVPQLSSKEQKRNKVYIIPLIFISRVISWFIRPMKLLIYSFILPPTLYFTFTSLLLLRFYF